MKKFLTFSVTLLAVLSVGLTFAEDEKGKDKADKGKAAEKGKGKGKGDPAKRIAAMLKKLDTDNSGTISEAEFLASEGAKKAKEAGKDPAKGFAMRDKNKDGELDKTELAVRRGGKGKAKDGDKGKGDKPKGDKPKKDQPAE